MHTLKSEVGCGGQRKNKIATPRGENESEYTTSDCQDRALHQQLPNDLPARSTDRSAHREFPCPRCTARRKQIREINASDEQHHADRNEEQRQARAIEAHLIFQKRSDGGADVEIGFWITLLQSRRDLLHLRTRRLNRDALLEPAPTEQTRMIATLHPPWSDTATLERKPNFSRTRRKHLRRHHSNDGVKFAGEIQRASEHGWIALEKSLPELIADHRKSRPTGAILLFRKDSPDLRFQSDHLEKIRRHQSPGNLFRLSALQPAQVIGLTPCHCDTLEDGVFFFPIEIIGKRNRNGRLVRVRFSHNR